MFKKITIIVIFVVFVYSPCSQSSTNNSQSFMPTITNSYQGNIEDIRFIELQISAVLIDMDRYIGWFFEEKDMIKRGSIKAIDDLKIIKDYLQQISFTGDLSELRDRNLTFIEKLIHIYGGIELKTYEKIKKDFDEYSEIYCQYLKKFEAYLKKHKYVGDLPEDLALIQNVDPNEIDIEKKIDLLSSILDAGEYSPLLFEIFCKWRTRTQEFWHGMSNRSEIPNWQYNLKRWKVVQTIKIYIETNPDDAWAKAQKILLMDIPNIGRGGDYGNDALNRGKVYLEKE